MRGRENIGECARSRLDIEQLRERFPSLGQLTPPVRELFFKGDADLLWKSDLFVAIIGTRKATTYGVKTADMFAGHLSRNGCCVVSGLAMGIDAAAHRGALARGGNTVGVSATGID